MTNEEKRDLHGDTHPNQKRKRAFPSNEKPTTPFYLLSFDVSCEVYLQSGWYALTDYIPFLFIRWAFYSMEFVIGLQIRL